MQHQKCLQDCPSLLLQRFLVTSNRLQGELKEFEAKTQHPRIYGNEAMPLVLWLVLSTHLERSLLGLPSPLRGLNHAYPISTGSFVSAEFARLCPLS